jgi:hypothetical protein
MYENQIKNREELLKKFNNKNLENNKKIESTNNCIKIVTYELENLKNAQARHSLEQMWDLIQDIGIVPIDTSTQNNQYTTSEGVKVNYTTAEGIKQMNQFSPQKENRILVVDIKYLPSEYKGMTPDKVVELLEESYGHSVFLIDSSAQNLQGSTSVYNNLPIYFA